MSFKTIVAASLVSVAAFGVANASTVNPGKAQLALQAGIAASEAGNYTVGQLRDLREARSENDTFAVNAIIAQADNGARQSTSGTIGVNAGKAQLAAQAGAPAAAGATLTKGQLVQLREARAEGDTATVNYLLSIVSAGRNATGNASVVTPAKAQLASRLGVDPAGYTFSELKALEEAKRD